MDIMKFEENEEITNYQEIDCQERSQLIDNLYQLIKSTQSSLVISVEAPWGCGKTFFAKYCESEFRKKRGFTIYFNAWESDYSEDPFIVFYDEILKVIEEEKEKDSKFLEIYNRYKKVGMEILNYSLPLIIKLLTNGLIDIGKIGPLLKGKISDSDISSMLTNFSEEKISAYKNKKKSIVEFKQILAEFVKKIQEGKGEKQVFAIFVDELDRCRPSYAIELIENIKHLFNIDGITFILSLDIDQLKKSIETLYGDMDSEGYLKRFFDYRVLLPEPQLQSFGDYLFKRYLFEEKFNQNKTGNIVDWFVFLSNPYNPSLRDFEKIFYEFNILLNTSNDSKIKEMPALLILLLILKHKNIVIYKKIHDISFSIGELDEIYGNIKKHTDYLNSNKKWLNLRSYLMISIMNKNSQENEIERISGIINNQNADKDLWINARYVSTIIRDSNKRNWYLNEVQKLLKQIDFVDKFYIES